MTIERGARVRQSVIADGVRIPGGATIERAVVVRRDRVKEIERGEIAGDNIIVQLNRRLREYGFSIGNRFGCNRTVGGILPERRSGRCIDHEADWRRVHSFVLSRPVGRKDCHRRAIWLAFDERETAVERLARLEAENVSARLTFANDPCAHLEVTRLLLDAGLPVPRILAVSGSESAILIQDVGDLRLQDWIETRADKEVTKHTGRRSS